MRHVAIRLAILTLVALPFAAAASAAASPMTAVQAHRYLVTENPRFLFPDITKITAASCVGAGKSDGKSRGRLLYLAFKCQSTYLDDTTGNGIGSTTPTKTGTLWVVPNPKSSGLVCASLTSSTAALKSCG